MKQKLFIYAAFGVLLLIGGCYPKGAEFVDELDITGSFHKPEYDFSAPKTYFLIDTVVHVVDGDVNEEPDHKYDDLILDKIEMHLKSLGYEEGSEDDVDLKVAVTALQSNYSGYYWWYYWDYWWGWYPWGATSPNWGYPGYPGWGYPIYYSYTIGTVLVEMVDPNEMIEHPIEPGTKIRPTVYTGVLNGLLQGSDAYIKGRIENSIDELFTELAPFRATPTPY